MRRNQCWVIERSCGRAGFRPFLVCHKKTAKERNKELKLYTLLYECEFRLRKYTSESVTGD